MSLANYTELFRSESREHITEINHRLLALEVDPGAPGAVEAIFRSVHTIKGMAATLGCAGAADLAHELESVLHRLRAGEAAPADGVVELLFRATDALEQAIDAWVRTGEDGAAPAPLIAELRGIDAAYTAGAGPADAVPALGLVGSAAGPATAGAPGARGEVPTFEVRLVVAGSASLPGARAFVALREARSMGRVDGLVPAEAELLGDGFAGSLRFLLHTEASAETVRTRLLAVGELSDVELLPAGPQAGPAAGTAPASPPRGADPIAGTERRHVRVDAARLDALMDRVGELVIVRDRLLRARPADAAEALDEAIEQTSRLVSQLRDEVLEMRMVPVREVFDRFPRLVRDAARALGKQVDLVVDGDDIELDRSLLDRLAEPLVHLLRNAIDHGLEPPAERAARGKAERGRLRLSARRERSRVLIRVEDDGRGIDRERVTRRARELGLLSPAEQGPGEEDALELITRPGVTTAERVSEVSGRGVGLDVVATQVRALRGTLDIASRPGEGTSFSLRLPASVGLLRALLVDVGGSAYAIPIAHVAETVEFRPAEIHEVAGSRVAFLREEPLPLIRVREVLFGAADAAAADRTCVVVVETDEQWFGLEVDGLLGQQEVVTKPFDATRETRPVFAGATILSDGSPALMLDAAALMRHGRGAQATRIFPEER